MGAARGGKPPRTHRLRLRELDVVGSGGDSRIGLCGGWRHRCFNGFQAGRFRPRVDRGDRSRGVAAGLDAAVEMNDGAATVDVARGCARSAVVDASAAGR